MLVQAPWREPLASADCVSPEFHVWQKGHCHPQRLLWLQQVGDRALQAGRTRCEAPDSLPLGDVHTGKGSSIAWAKDYIWSMRRKEQKNVYKPCINSKFVKTTPLRHLVSLCDCKLCKWMGFSSRSKGLARLTVSNHEYINIERSSLSTVLWFP